MKLTWTGGLVVLVCLGAVAVPVHGALLYADNFNDLDAIGWEEYDGLFTAGFGAYEIESTSFANDARSVVGDPGWTDYVIEADVNIARRDGSTTHPSILFRIQEIASGTDAGRYYQFHMHPDKVGFAEIDYSGGMANILIESPYTVSINTWYHVRLEVAGDQATAYLNGVQVLTYSGFTAYSSGRIGLKTINDGVVFFDNVVVTPEPATLSLLAIGGLALIGRRRRRA